MIQNIESGRKPDPAVSQLLEIAFGIGISPMLLLIEFDQPFSTLDLPNLSGELARMTNDKFDQWVSAADREPLGDSYAATNLQMARRDVREIVKYLGYWDDAEWARAAPEEEFSELDAEQQKLQESRIDALVKRIGDDADLSWHNRPWIDNSAAGSDE